MSIYKLTIFSINFFWNNNTNLNVIYFKVSIGHIVPGGSADLDGRVRTGDQIISINSKSTINTSHDYVINLISQCKQITIGIRHINYNCV